MKYTVHNTLINELSTPQNFNPRDILWHCRIPKENYTRTHPWPEQSTIANPNLTNVSHWGLNWPMQEKVSDHWTSDLNLNYPINELEVFDNPGLRFKISKHLKDVDYYKKYINDMQISTRSHRNECDVAVIQHLNQHQIDTFNILDLFTFNEVVEENDSIHYTNSKPQLLDHFEFYDATEVFKEKLQENSLHLFECMILSHDNFIISPNDLLSQYINHALVSADTDKKIKMYDIKKLCRGSGPAEMEIKEKNIKAFSKGYKIIPIKYSFEEFNIKTNETFTSTAYFFLTNFNQSVVRKYRKANAFISNLENYSKCNEGAWYYDIDLFNKLEERKFGKNVVYWDKMSSIFKNTHQEYNKIIPHTQVKETEFDPKLYSFYSKIKRTKDNTHYASYIKNTSRLNEIETKINNLETSKQTISRRKTRVENAIESSKRDLERFSLDLKSIEKEQEEIQVNLPSYIEIKDSLTPKIVTLKENYKKFLQDFSESILTDDTEDKYRINFENKGIVIDSVKYQDRSSGEVFSLKDSKTLLSSIDPDSNLEIHSVDFRITKPVLIYVDKMEKGENCKKVVGGPYIITCTSSNLEIGLLSSASVFGYSSNNRNAIYIHPHANTVGVNTSSPDLFWSGILNIKARACLGEASQAVHSAFKAKDIRQIILACMTWVTSANSSDTWGRNYKYFPKPEEIKESKNNIRITKDYIKSQVFEDQIKEPEGVMDLLYDILPEESIEEDQSDNQQTQDLPAQLQESIERLRRAGNPNYQPLYRSANNET